jgi:hypothetical protein
VNVSGVRLRTVINTTAFEVLAGWATF